MVCHLLLIADGYAVRQGILCQTARDNAPVSFVASDDLVAARVIDAGNLQVM